MRRPPAQAQRLATLRHAVGPGLRGPQRAYVCDRCACEAAGVAPHRRGELGLPRLVKVTVRVRVRVGVRARARVRVRVRVRVGVGARARYLRLYLAQQPAVGRGAWAVVHLVRVRARVGVRARVRVKG